MVEIKELVSYPFLEGLTESEIGALASIAVQSNWKEGEEFFRAHTPATNLYLLKSGTVLLCFPSGRSFPIRERGQAIGWSSLVNPFYYTATGLCLTDVSLYQFPGTELYRLIRMDSYLGHRLMHKIAQIMGERKPYRQPTQKK